MALPSSGQLALSQIATELAARSTNISLRNMSATAGFTSPDAVSEFYGYSNRSLTLSNFSSVTFDAYGIPCANDPVDFTVTSTEAWYVVGFPGPIPMSPTSGNAGNTLCTALWTGNKGDTETAIFKYTSDNALAGATLWVFNLSVGEECF